MRRKPKIIHILSHSPSPLAYVNFEKAELPRYYHETSVPPYWVGFFELDFHAQLARETLKRTDEYELECWRPYGLADKVYSKDIDGVTHRLFPSHDLRVGSFGLGERSPSMVKALRKELKTNDRILIHLHGLYHPSINYLLARMKLGDIPVVIQHCGGMSYYGRYLLSHKPVHNLLSRYQKWLLKDIDHFLVLLNREKEELTRLVDAPIDISTYGLNFDTFVPGNKEKAREELGLPADKKVLLFVGRFEKIKGVDIILEAYQELKARYDLLLILIGGFERDDCYPLVRELSDEVIVKSRVAREELLRHYNAADIYVHPMLSPYHRGNDGTILEAAGCGTPVIARSLEFFSPEEQEVLGILPETPPDVTNGIEQILENIDHYSNPEMRSKRREIVVTNHSWEESVTRRLNIYRKLFEKYHAN